MAMAVAAVFAAHFAMPVFRPVPVRAAAGPRSAAAEEVFETGRASWYGSPGDGFAYRTTANGETMDPEAWTCAHRSLPFGTIVTVENLLNGRVAMLRVNDRGPYARGRIVDLSRRGAAELGLLGTGVAPVRIRLVEGVLKGHVTRAVRRRPGAAPQVPQVIAAAAHESGPGPRSAFPAPAPAAAAAVAHESRPGTRRWLAELTRMGPGGRLRRAPSAQDEGAGGGHGTRRPGRPNRLDPFINRES
jgi:rare lipoprotein A